MENVLQDSEDDLDGDQGVDDHLKLEKEASSLPRQKTRCLSFLFLEERI